MEIKKIDSQIFNLNCKLRFLIRERKKYQNFTFSVQTCKKSVCNNLQQRIIAENRKKMHNHIK